MQWPFTEACPAVASDESYQGGKCHSSKSLNTPLIEFEIVCIFLPLMKKALIEGIGGRRNHILPPPLSCLLCPRGRKFKQFFTRLMKIFLPWCQKFLDMPLTLYISHSSVCLLNTVFQYLFFVYFIKAFLVDEPVEPYKKALAL